MTLGEEWKQSLDDSEKDIIFEFLENAIKDAIDQRKKYVWITYNTIYKGIVVTEVDEEIFKEFAAKNGLNVKKTIYSDWIIMPKE